MSERVSEFHLLRYIRVVALCQEAIGGVNLSQSDALQEVLLLLLLLLCGSDGPQRDKGQEHHKELYGGRMHSAAMIWLLLIFKINSSSGSLMSEEAKQKQARAERERATSHGEGETES